MFTATFSIWVSNSSLLPLESSYFRLKLNESNLLFQSFTEDKYEVLLADVEAALWVISAEEPRIQITITFSSVTMRESGTGRNRSRINLHIFRAILSVN